MRFLQHKIHNKQHERSKQEDTCEYSQCPPLPIMRGVHSRHGEKKHASLIVSGIVSFLVVFEFCLGKETRKRPSHDTQTKQKHRGSIGTKCISSRCHAYCYTYTQKRQGCIGQFIGHLCNSFQPPAFLYLNLASKSKRPNTALTTPNSVRCEDWRARVSTNALARPFSLFNFISLAEETRWWVTAHAPALCVPNVKLSSTMSSN